MLPFKFVLKEPKYRICDVFYVRIEPTRLYSETEFLNSLFYQLWLPGYFGFNWDALLDCLCDFSWIRYYKICILHYDIPNLSTTDLKIYLEIILDASYLWKRYNEHELEIIFFEKDKENIENILHNYNLKFLNN